MLNLAIFSYAMPYLRNLPPYNQIGQYVELLDHDVGRVVHDLTLTFAGVLQTHLQRVLGGGIWRYRISSCCSIGCGSARGWSLYWAGSCSSMR